MNMQVFAILLEYEAYLAKMVTIRPENKTDYLFA
jgi:hypothetical protein